MAKPTIRFGRFSWRVVGGARDSVDGTYLSAQPLDDASMTLFDSGGRRGALSLDIALGCSDEDAARLRDMLNRCVSSVGLTQFDEGPLPL